MGVEGVWKGLGWGGDELCCMSEDLFIYLGWGEG